MGLIEPCRWWKHDFPEHWNAASRQYCFQKLSPDQVPKGFLDRIQIVRSFLSAELSIVNPTRVIPVAPVNWLADGSWQGWQSPVVAEGERRFCRMDTDLGGYTPRSRADEIWLRTDLTSDRLEIIAAHEFRHDFQKRCAPGLFNDTASAEADAITYGYGATERIFEAQGILSEAMRRNLRDRCSRELKCLQLAPMTRAFWEAFSRWRQEGEQE